MEVIPAGRPLDPGHPVQPRLQRPDGVPGEMYIRREHLSKYEEGFQITRVHSSLCRDRICEHMKSEGHVADHEKLVNGR